MGIKLDGIERLTALEKLVLVGRGSKLGRDFRQVLSPYPSGVLPCPLLSTIYCYWSASETRDIFRLVRIRSSAGRTLRKLSVPTSSIALPADIASCVSYVGSLDIPTDILDVDAVGLPRFYFLDDE